MTEQGAGPDPTTLSSGAKIIGGAYEVDRLIKAGGMGEVYRGRNVQTGRAVAIKIILASLARNETYMALFEREALILEELAHEAIVRYQLYAVDQTTGRPCLVMQFVPGPSLKERMEQGPMSAADIRLLTKRLASGLAAAHNHDYKVYHRDLSPDNVILEDGRVEKAKLIDFGIAKGGAQSAEKSMLAGQIAGKFSYMAPEQLGLFGDEIDARTDIYSLGLIILGLFRGKAVDMGKNIGEAVMRRQSVPDLSAASPELQPLLHSMLSPQPADRPLNMERVLELLEEAKPVLPRPIEAFDAGPTVLTPRPDVLPGLEDVAPEPTPRPLPVAEPTPRPLPEPTPPPVARQEGPADHDATIIKPVSARAAPQKPDTAQKAGAEPVSAQPVSSQAKPEPLSPNAFAPEAPGPETPLPEAPVSQSLGLGDLDDLLPPAKPAEPKAAPAPQKPEPQKSETKKSDAQKSGALLPVLALGVLAVLGGGAYVFLGGQGEAPVQTAAVAPEPVVPEPAPAEPEPVPTPDPVAPEPVVPDPVVPEPVTPPAPSPAELRAAILGQWPTLREGLFGSCSFLRLEGSDGAARLVARAPSQDQANAALARITLPEGGDLARETRLLPATDVFCGAIELANLRDDPEAAKPIRLEAQGLTSNSLSGNALASGSELTLRVAGADAMTRAYLIGASGRVTPLALTQDSASLRLELAPEAPAVVPEMILALSAGVALPGLEALVDGHSADSALRLIAHELQKSGAKASIDILTFDLTK